MIWAILPWLLLLGGAALAHLRLIPPLAGFTIAVLSLPASVAALVALGWDWWRGGSVSLVGVACVVAVFPVILLLFAGRDVFRYPRINDVSTDLERPPEFVAIADLPENEDRNLDFPPVAADIITSSYPNAIPASWSERDTDAETVFAAVIQVVGERPNWKIVRADHDAKELEAIVESTVFRFRDYVSVRVSRDGDRVRADVRSKSRDGKSDLGVNARRIESFLNALSARIDAP